MLARFRTRHQQDGGFTLIELLVVMIIIGVLAAIAIPVFLNQRQRAVDTSVKADLKAMATEVETFLVDGQAVVEANASWLSSYQTMTGTTLPPEFSIRNVVTPGNAVQFKWRGGGAYCLRGYATQAGRASTTGAGGSTGTYFVYDSAAGGLQPGAPRTTTESGTAAC